MGLSPRAVLWIKGPVIKANVFLRGAQMRVVQRRIETFTGARHHKSKEETTLFLGTDAVYVKQMMHLDEWLI